MTMMTETRPARNDAQSVNAVRRVAQWFASRLLLILFMLAPGEVHVLNGLYPYWHWSHGAYCHGIIPGRDFPWEYPPGALPFVLLPIGCTSQGVYDAAFVAFALALDLLILMVLQTLPRGRTASRLWLIALPLIGPIFITRFDIAACLFVAVGLTWCTRRPALAGAALAVGLAVKLWPAVLLALVLVKGDRRRRVLLGASVTLAILALASVAGGTSSLSALRYQSARGLQIESVPALPWMWAHAARHGHVAFHFGAWEVSGAGSHVVAVASGWIGIGLFAALAARAARTPHTQLDLPLLSSASVAVLLVTDKVLSPQYLIWLITAVGVLVGTRPVTRSLLRLGLVACCLTPLIFPANYAALIRGAVGPVALLTVRDLAVLAIAVVLYRQAWRSCRVPTRLQQSPSARPHLPVGAS